MKVLKLLLLCSALIIEARGQNMPLKQHDFPSPVDTQNKEIHFQKKQIYSFKEAGIYFDNQFDGARLNHVKMLNDSTFVVRIEPENEPINSSPWYAFKVWSVEDKNISIQMEYALSDGTVKHRYHPKISDDGHKWNKLDSTQIQSLEKTISFKIKVRPDTVWIAAQPIISSKHVLGWVSGLSESRIVHRHSAGKSVLKRELIALEINRKKNKKKDIIVLLSRQHPPETTGFVALQTFVERLLEQDRLSKRFLKKYTLLVYPLLNPDGVDLGHWRHNVNGVDLNRDWAQYNQPEIRQIAQHIVEQKNRLKEDVVLGIDFHSTWYDIYYTNTTDSATILPHFSQDWIERIKKVFPYDKASVRPSGLGKPVSKGWFYVQFNAVGVTYEIGDNTPLDKVKLKGTVSAEKMMEILLER